MSFAQIAVLAALVVLAGVWDWRWRRIPNWLIVAGAVGGLAVNAPMSAAKGLGIAVLVYLPLFLLRAVGGGDLKLMAAMGIITGHEVWLVLFVLSAVGGGIAALALVIAKKRLRRTLANVGHILRSAPAAELPHAQRPELNVRDPEALTIPRGTVIAVTTLLYLGARAL